MNFLNRYTPDEDLLGQYAYLQKSFIKSSLVKKVFPFPIGPFITIGISLSNNNEIKLKIKCPENVVIVKYI